MSREQKKGLYWAAKDIEELVFEKDGEQTAQAIGHRDNKTRLEVLASTLPGEITYIGKLAVATPNAGNWRQIVDSGGRVIREHLQALPDEEVIKVVVYDDKALSLYTIDALLAFKRLISGLHDQNYGECVEADTKFKRALLTIGTMAAHSDEEFIDEFKKRRRDRFLDGRAGENLLFERSINKTTLSAPYDIEETFWRIGYSPIE
jgi:hypothetical protein